MQMRGGFSDEEVNKVEIRRHKACSAWRCCYNDEDGPVTFISLYVGRRLRQECRSAIDQDVSSGEYLKWKDEEDQEKLFS